MSSPRSLIGLSCCGKPAGRPKVRNYVTGIYEKNSNIKLPQRIGTINTLTPVSLVSSRSQVGMWERRCGCRLRPQALRFPTFIGTMGS
jgi:hypothetical protein